MEFYFYLNSSELPTSKELLVKKLEENTFSDGDELFFFDKSGDKIVLDKNSLESLKENMTDSKVKFSWNKRNLISESICLDFEDLNVENINRSNLVQSMILTFPEVRKEETLEKELKFVNSYLNHLYENFDYNISNVLSPLQIIDQLDKEYFKEVNRNEAIDSFYKLIKKIDNHFIKLNNLKNHMENNNLKFRIKEDEMKEQMNKLLSENQAYKEDAKMTKYYQSELEKLQNLLKETKEQSIEIEKKYLKSVEDLQILLKETKEQSIEIEKKYLKSVKDLQILQNLLNEAKEQSIEIEKKYLKSVEDFKKEIEEKNQNVNVLKQLCERNSYENINLKEQIKDRSQETTYFKLHSFCKFLNEKVVFPKINDESLLKFVRNQANIFSKDEKDKNEIQQVELLFEKIDKLIENYTKLFNNDLTTTKTKQISIEKDFKESKNEILKIKKENDLLILELKNANLKTTDMMNQLDEKKSEIFILTEKISELNLELQSIKESTNDVEYYKQVENFLMKIKEQLMNMYSTAINFSSFVKDENVMKENYRKNIDSLNKIKDVFFCVENLITYLFQTIKKLDEIDLLKIYELDVRLFKKYKICNFCDNFKETCHLMDLCDKHSICLHCYNKQNLPKCINCGYKSHFD